MNVTTFTDSPKNPSSPQNISSLSVVKSEPEDMLPAKLVIFYSLSVLKDKLFVLPLLIIIANKMLKSKWRRSQHQNLKF